MKIKKLAFAVIAGCIALGACSSSPVVLTEDQSNAKRSVVMASGIDMEDLRVRSKVREDGLTLVSFKAIATGTETVYAKIVWEDEDGMTINTTLSSWSMKKIVSGTPVSWEFIAPVSNAKNYKIIITDDIGKGTLDV